MSKDDMILDLDNFDFGLIDAEEPTTTTKVEEDFLWNDDDDADDSYDDDVSDLDDEFVDDEEDEDEVVEDEEIPLDAIASRFNDLPEDAELDLGDYKATKGEIVSHIKNIDEFNTRKSQLDTYFQSFESIDKQMNDQFVRAYTETELKLNNFKNRLRNPDLMDHERGMIYRDIEKLEANRSLINESVEKYNNQRRVRDEQSEQVRLNETNTEMAKRYGKEWVSKMAPSLTNYIVDSGLASPEMRKALSPALLEMVIKAQKYDNLSKSSTEKVKAKAAGRTRSTSSKSSKKNQASKVSSKAAALRAYEQGKLSTEDMFKYLDD